MTRRRLTVGAGVAAAAAVAAALVLGGTSAEGQDGDGDDDQADAEVTTAEVTSRDLTESEDLDGTLGYGDAIEVALGGSGTITDLADEGAVVQPGGVLAEVDGEPVVLLTGTSAAWRQLDAGASAGDDVQQLEQSLVDLGFAGDDLDVDGTWTTATTAAVRALQATLGMAEDGALEPGSVVFAPGAVRVAAHLVEVGGAAGGAVVEVTSTTRIVTVDIDAADQGVVEPGQEVEVELPDGTSVDAVVYRVSDVVDSPGQEGGDPTVEVVIAFADGAETGTVDQAPVDISVVTVAVEDALCVPVEALLALAEGGYAVEQPDGSLVAVELGAFADGYVQVDGELAEGDDVVVAR